MATVSKLKCPMQDKKFIVNYTDTCIVDNNFGWTVYNDSFVTEHDQHGWQRTDQVSVCYSDKTSF